jgi:3-oxoacyl-[acyl-carrier-protein] synthase II
MSLDRSFAMERVVITGIGLVTPVGIGTAETWQALLEGRNGIGPITLFDASAFRARIAGEVKGWDPLRWIERKKLKEMDRFTEFALGAAAMAMSDAKLVLAEDPARHRAGCFIGVGLCGLFTLEKTKETVMTKGSTKVSPYTIPGIIANLAAGQVAIAHGLKGWIRRGRVDVMVAGGTEATITPVGIAGFEAMLALSKRNDDPAHASRPFDRGRDGFVSGEGSGVMVLESLSHAKARGARIYAEVTGYGASTDAYHLTQPAPEHEGAQRAMRMALDDAKITPDDVDYVNAHGTSTPIGDVEESRAIAKVFPRATAASPSERLWVSSTKSMMGHLLGAAGAVETAICALTVADGRVAPTINLTDQDPECTLDYVANTARERRVRHVMNNSFGFGGTNCAVVLSRFEG